MSREQADDLLQETWLRIHRVRHTYRPGQPVLPWVYAIARRVRVDGYRRTRRIRAHEIPTEVLPEPRARSETRNSLPAFETLVSILPEAQREVVTMLKAGGLSLDEVARATSCTVGAVKQKASRAYERLRSLLQEKKNEFYRDVECSLIEHEKSGAARLPAQLQDHILTCNSCSEFLRALNPSITADAPAPEILRRLEITLTTGLRPVRPLAPARYFFAVFGVIFILIVAAGVYRLGASGVSAMSTGQSIAILCALSASAGALVYSLVHQMTPGSRHRISPTLLPAAVIGFLALLMVALFQFQPERDFWGTGLACLRAGGPLALLAAVPFWLLLRRGAGLSPRVTGASAGLLAGLVTTSAQEIYCPMLDASHILTWHLGVALLGAGIGLAAGLAAEAAGERLRSALG